MGERIEASCYLKCIEAFSTKGYAIDRLDRTWEASPPIPRPCT